ncbi:DUF6049 family protein [Arcanobacterium hippocoleae]|uniref:DUF6049 family protein n=1 Tax=Arcanobacterium hippocoleae TaxID=149017 RepID=UPI00333F78C9
MSSLDFPGVTAFLDSALLANKQVQKFLQHTQHLQQLFLPYADADLAALFLANQPDLAHDALAFRLQSLQQSQAQSSAGKRADVRQIALLQDLPSATLLRMLAQENVYTAIVSGAQREIAGEFFYTQEATRKISLPGAKEHADKKATEFTLLFSHDQISHALSGRLTTYQDTAGIELDRSDREPLAVALSAVYFNEAPNLSRPLLIQIPRQLANSVAADGKQEKLAEILKSLTAAPWLSATSVSGIIKQDPPIRDLPWRDPVQAAPEKDSKPAAQPLISAQEIAHLSDAAARFVSDTKIFPATPEFTDLAKASALTALATSWRENPRARAKYLQELFNPALFSQNLSFEPSSPINMISESSSLPVKVRNNFNFPAQVQIDLVSPDLRLKSNQTVRVQLQPKQVQSVGIPLTARGSGNIKVKLKILDSAGMEIGTPSILPMRIRANWESTGTMILGGFFALILIYGIYRSVRGGRRGKPMSQAEIESAVQ